MIRNLMIMISITIPWTLLMFVVSPFRLLIASMIILKSWNIIILRSASTSPSLVSLRLIVSVKIMNLLLVIVRMIVVKVIMKIKMQAALACRNEKVVMMKGLRPGMVSRLLFVLKRKTRLILQNTYLTKKYQNTKQMNAKNCLRRSEE